MKKRFWIVGIVLTLFISGTSISSVFASSSGNIEAHEKVDGELFDDTHMEQPSSLAWAAQQVARGALMEAGKKAFQWAKEKYDGRWAEQPLSDDEELDVLFDQ